MSRFLSRVRCSSVSDLDFATSPSKTRKGFDCGTGRVCSVQLDIKASKDKVDRKGRA